MSKLNYVGPRVVISHSGIFYKLSKEDKYIYLTAALTVLKTLYNNDIDHTINVVVNQNEDLDEISLSHYLKQYEDHFENSIEHETSQYMQKIDHTIEYIKKMSHISNIDKEVWIKNVNKMKQYNVKRAVNKIYYMHLIEHIIQSIKAKKIKEIHTPFTKKTFHVLNTIKGRLITGKPSLDAKVLHAYDNVDNMILKLIVRM